MFLFYLYLIIAAAAAIAVSFISVTSPIMLWIPFAVFAGATLLLWLVHILTITIASIFADTAHRPETLDNPIRRLSLATLDTFMATAGCRFRLENTQALPDEPFLLVCNHLSIIDPLAMMTVFRRNKVAFISKKENKKIPVISRCMIPCGCLFLDRDDSRSAVYTIRDAAAFIADGIGSMAICPEGTRNRTEQPVLPFHAGSFKIATKAGCPLVIVGISGTERLYKNFPLRKTPITVRVLDVIPAETVKQTKSTQLAATAEQTIGDWLVSVKK